MAGLFIYLLKASLGKSKTCHTVNCHLSTLPPPSIALQHGHTKTPATTIGSAGADLQHQNRKTRNLFLY